LSFTLVAYWQLFFVIYITALMSDI